MTAYARQVYKMDGGFYRWVWELAPSLQGPWLEIVGAPPFLTEAVVDLGRMHQDEAGNYIQLRS